jgi:hypothetical protein
MTRSAGDPLRLKPRRDMMHVDVMSRRAKLIPLSLRFRRALQRGGRLAWGNENFGVVPRAFLSIPSRARRPSLDD